MKTTILILLTIVSIARANLIDLGGFNINDPLPPFAQQFFRTPLIAGANIINGQVVWSPFTLFGPDQFSLTPTSPTTATTSWDLSNTNGYQLRFVLVEGINGEDELFRTNGRGLIMGFGDLFNLTDIQAVNYAGSNVVPDSGTTWELLAMGVGCLIIFRLRKVTQ